MANGYNPFLGYGEVPYQSQMPWMYSPDSATGATSGNPVLSRATPGGGSSWMGYAGLGAAAAAPIAAVLIGKNRTQTPGYAPAASVGSKPTMQVNSNIYPQQQRMPAFLARLLMGAK